MKRKASLSRRNRARRSHLPDGFTLMELLIVMAIIVILLLMVSANVGLVMKKAHETSAIHSELFTGLWTGCLRCCARVC